MQKKNVFFSLFIDEAWLKRLVYLAVIFDALNKFKLRLQGDETNILQFKDILCGLVDKMKNWKRKVSQGNFAMFENLFQFRRLS